PACDERRRRPLPSGGAPALAVVGPLTFTTAPPRRLTLPYTQMTFLRPTRDRPRALPIREGLRARQVRGVARRPGGRRRSSAGGPDRTSPGRCSRPSCTRCCRCPHTACCSRRSEEHTSELQSLAY